MTGSAEAHNQRTIGLVLKHLCRVEQEGPRMGGYFRFELPDHFAKFCIILKSSKSLLCVLIDIEFRIAFENLSGKLRA
jgi:hypothetical protein